MNKKKLQILIIKFDERKSMKKLKITFVKKSATCIHTDTLLL